MFVVPAVLLGFCLAIPCIWVVYKAMGTEDLGFEPSVLPDWYSTAQALTIGIVIPIVSSIVPIQRALSKNLTDALNTQRKTTSGVVISFTNTGAKNFVPYFVFGTASVLFGISIYYFLPLGLLQQNYGLILSIFFLILFGMMLGLTVFVTNMQGILETLLIYIFFFWE